MNHWRKLLLVGSGIALSFVSAIGATHRAEKLTPTRLALEVTITGNQSLRVFVPETNSQRVVAMVPVPGNSTAERSKTQASGILVAPQMEGASVRVDVSAIFGKIDTKTSLCEQLKLLKREAVGVYRISEKSAVSTEGMARIGMPGFSLRLVRMPVAQDAEIEQGPSGRPCECCKCGNLKCCPDPGKCIGCGSCGQCCCE